MELCVLLYALILFHFQILCTNQELSLPPSLLETESTQAQEGCLERFLHQSRAKLIHLVCDSKATYCPATVIDKIRVTSWILVNGNFSFGDIEENGYCVIAGDNVSHLHGALTSHLPYLKEKLVLVVPNDASGQPPALEKLFSAAWDFGIIDIVVVVTDSLCRLFTYFPIRQQSKVRCPDLTPVLVASWARDSKAAPNDRSLNIFPNHVITSLHLCEVQVRIKSDVQVYWSPVVDFLKLAMNATSTSF